MPGVPEDVELGERISDEIASIHRESYGEEVRSARTVVSNDLVVCMLDIALLPHERTLLASDGGRDAMQRVRQEFQEAIGATFVAAVEHATGRRVIGFLSNTHYEPHFSVELFRLAPRGD